MDRAPRKTICAESATPTAAPAADRPITLSAPLALLSPALQVPYPPAYTSDTVSARFWPKGNAAPVRVIIYSQSIDKPVSRSSMMSVSMPYLAVIRQEGQC